MIKCFELAPNLSGKEAKETAEMMNGESFYLGRRPK
jgi:hypothetical protein